MSRVIYRWGRWSDGGDRGRAGQVAMNEMTIFYKATRPDGTDFYTGEVDYAAALESGEHLPALSGKGSFPGLGWYHLATVPTECVGMSWPCRLFEVEPVGDVFMDSAHPHKIGATAVRVLREIEAHRVFGPQGVQVAALIERCATLTADEVSRLYAATPGAARGVATRDATRGIARGTARVAAWDAALYAATPGAARDAARDAARGAALGATWGLLLRDLIGQRPGWDQDAYDLLTGPWRSVIGPVHPDDGDSDD